MKNCYSRQGTSLLQFPLKLTTDLSLDAIGRNFISFQGKRESYLRSKKAELIQRLTPICEITEYEYQTEGFDWFGDDDLLKLNFGGNSVDIKRSVLTKSKVDWNLFYLSRNDGMLFM
jgi:hypothetical protein